MEEKFIDYTADKQKLFKAQKQSFENNYKSFFPEDKSASILDLGIGRGEMLACMQEWEYQNYLGVDISKRVVDFCQQAGYNCMLVEDSVKFLYDHPGEYELITMLDVLEHCSKEDAVELLKAIAHALCDGGKLIIQTPNMQAPYAYMTRYHDITHLVGLDERSVGQLLTAAEFSEYTCYAYDEFIGLQLIRRILRKVYQFSVRVCRYINGMLNPKILNTRFFAVALKK